ncbi:respiratory nitrate reductase subunit gamma [Oceanithermus desulfurans]
MNWNRLLFEIFPYLALVVAVVVTLYRYAYRPFSVSALSSQLLERRLLFWGSLPFHWGITLILTVHLIAWIFPEAIYAWNASLFRLYLLEVSGFALALWTLAGLVVLLWRRLVNAKVRATATAMDYLVLFAVLISVLTGLYTALAYRFGSSWFAGTMAPYLTSILTLRPRPELVADLPFAFQWHVFNFWVLLALFPFSRLVHIITVPLGYVARPWQIVIWVRRRFTQPNP